MALENDKLKRALHTPEEAAVHEEDESIWLVSYADLMTLMFTFFVMLYASLLNEDTESLRRTLSTFVQGDGSSISSGGKVPGNQGTGSEGTQNLKMALSERLELEDWMSDVQVTLNQQGLNLTFASNLLFDLGASELRENSQATLEKMIALIHSKAPKIRVRIEGHTDDNPIKSGRFKTNWELSGARAAHIAALFEKNGMDPQRIVAIGYGESRPMKPNRDPAGIPDLKAQQANRRVVITLYEENSEEKAGPRPAGAN